MVKSTKSNFQQDRNYKGFSENRTKAKKINTFNNIRYLQRVAEPAWRAFGADQIFGSDRFSADISLQRENRCRSRYLPFLLLRESLKNAQWALFVIIVASG
jgi:hypothetical protein